ncbi:MAG: DUF4199 domain-containing protein [Bacteroidota bacterium]
MDNTQTNSPTLLSIALKWGAIWGLTGIIMTVLSPMLMEMSSGYLLSLVLLLVTIILVFLFQYKAIHEYRSAQADGYITYGKAFQVAFMTSLISVLILTLYTFINYTFITDIAVESQQMLDKQIKMMKESGADEEKIKQSIAMTKKFSGLSSKIIATVVFGLIFDTIVSLITAAILKKSPAND